MLVILWIMSGSLAVMGIAMMLFKDADKKRTRVIDVLIICLGFVAILVLALRIPNGQPLTSLEDGAVYETVYEHQVVYKTAEPDDVILYLATDKKQGFRHYKIEHFRLRDENLKKIVDIPEVFKVVEKEDIWLPGESNVSKRNFDVYILIPQLSELLDHRVIP